MLFFQILKLLEWRHIRNLTISAVQLDVLLFLRLLVKSLQLVEVSLPGFHAHFLPLLLQLQVVHLLVWVIVLLQGLPVQESVSAALEHHSPSSTQVRGALPSCLVVGLRHSLLNALVALDRVGVPVHSIRRLALDVLNLAGQAILVAVPLTVLLSFAHSVLRGVLCVFVGGTLPFLRIIVELSVVIGVLVVRPRVAGLVRIF